MNAVKGAARGCYIVHYTVKDPTAQSVFGTSAPHPSREGALVDAANRIRSGRKAYVTQRDSQGRVIDTIVQSTIEKGILE